MKNYVLVALTLLLSTALYAQQNQTLRNGLESAVHHPKKAVAIESVSKPAPITTSDHAVPETTKGSKDLNIFEIGASANAYSYGYGGGQKTILWVDDNLNAVTNTHRMTADTYSGNLAMDLSLDGGQSFENNIMVYESNEPGPSYNSDAIRYPHGAIYNPLGNLDPANAHLFFFGPVLDGSNSSDDTWGGYGFGMANLVDFEDTVKHTRSSNLDEGMYQYIPEAFTVTQDGIAWAVDPADDWTSGTLDYTSNLIVNKGIYDEEEGNVIYEADLIDCEVIDDPDLYYIMNEKIAFGPDGQTGYMVVLSNDGSVEFSEGSVYPIVYKTTNGGDDWENMGGIQLGGEDGLERVKQFLTDEQLATLFDPVPGRDEILYTTAFDFDLVVDYSGNPHIAVMVGVTGVDPFSIVTEPYTFAAFDIWSTDGANSWTALDLKKVPSLRGEFGDATYTEDNRIQASTTMDGEKVFVSWLETDPEWSENNDMPDIQCVGIDPVGHLYTDTVDVTEYTMAWLQAYFFAAPHYVLTDDNKYTIPFTYEAMDPGDPAKPVTYMYIQDFAWTEADFKHEFPDGVGFNEDPVMISDINVSQNYPNPFSLTTTIDIHTDETMPVQVKVISLTGQVVYSEDAGTVNGHHSFKIDGNTLKPGVYFYTIKSGEETITRKMTVK
ncbi:MAG: T9SS type A sorting domain-containing protein [Bacteroidales bacterium]|nr:T9SS type A sorting domain-containing protein [Bacteroidales bacterium]